MTWSELLLRKDKVIGRGTLMGRRESRENTGYSFFYFIQVDLWLKNKKFDMFRIWYVFFLGVSTPSHQVTCPKTSHQSLFTLINVYLILAKFTYASLTSLFSQLIELRSSWENTQKHWSPICSLLKPKHFPILYTYFQPLGAGKNPRTQNCFHFFFFYYVLECCRYHVIPYLTSHTWIKKFKQMFYVCQGFIHLLDFFT